MHIENLCQDQPYLQFHYMNREDPRVNMRAVGSGAIFTVGYVHLQSLKVSSTTCLQNTTIQGPMRW